MSKAVKEAVSKIPVDQFTKLTYSGVVAMNLDIKDIEKGYYALYDRIGVMHGKKVGANINKQQKLFSVTPFVEIYRMGLRKWILENAGRNIVSVHSSVARYIIKFVSERLLLDQSIEQIVRDLKRHLVSRAMYRWQIERIVRTETTAAANHGATISADTSGVALIKEWISSDDERTRTLERGDRYDHLDMDGVQVDQNGMFNVNGDMVRYPGDPKGKPANIINCRCTVALRSKRDTAGNLVFVD